MATLGDYINEERRLLHDATGSYWSTPDLTAYTNRAVKQRDRDTGENRELVTFPFVAGQPNYTLTTIHPRAFDALGIFYYNGQWRYALSQVSYTDMASIVQPFRNLHQFPGYFSKYGPARIVIGPTPSQSFEAEWDLLIYSADLLQPSDADPLPYPWTDPVPFLACHFAKIEIQQYDEAQQFEAQYRTRLVGVMNGARGRMLQNAYYSMSGMQRW